MEGMLRNLQLSEAERKGLRIGSSRKAAADTGGAPQALGKVFSEKLIHAETVEQALGRMWCPIRGIECKALGDNKFLITFLQESWKMKALDEGPWMISKELLVVADVDRRKTLDEIEFVSVPIWVRIMNLSLGMMNKEAGVTIGKELGQFMMVDLEDGDVPIRRYRRVRIRLDIRRPLMRGVTVEDDDGVPDRWCPLLYEYLPDFCYVCGIIGHTERMCSVKLNEGEIPQFDKSLRFIPQKGRGDVERQRRLDAGTNTGRGSSLAGRGTSGGSGGRWGSDGSRSDAPSWKRISGGNDQAVGMKGRDEEEVTNPLKGTMKNQAMIGDKKPPSRKALSFTGKLKDSADDGRIGDLMEIFGEKPASTRADGKMLGKIDVAGDVHVNSGMQIMHANQVGEQGEVKVGEEPLGAGKSEARKSEGTVEKSTRRTYTRKNLAW